ncbi:MAG: lipopolysaccharide biosynthesis protein [Planctomycetota bacterium]
MTQLMRTEVRRTFVVAAGAAVTAVFSLVYQFVAGHTLGPVPYADFAAALSLIYIGSSAAGPVNSTVARFSAQFIARGELGKVRGLVEMATRRVAGFGLIAAVLALIGLRPLVRALHFSSAAPLVLAIAVLYLTLLVSVERGVLRGALDFARYNRSVVTEAALRLLIGVPLLYAFADAGSAVGGYAAALLVLLPLSAKQAKVTSKGEEAVPVSAPEVLRFGSPMFAFSMAFVTFLNGDMLLVKLFFHGPEAGLYGGAVTLARSIALIYGPFGILLLPAFVSQEAGGSPPFRMVLRVVAYFLAAAALPLAAMAIWPEEILTLAFGEAFGAAAPLLLPLAGAAALAGFSALMGNALAGLGRFRFLAVYIGGLLLMVSGLSLWHESLDRVVVVVLAVQVITAVAMLVLLLAAWWEHRGMPHAGGAGS